MYSIRFVHADGTVVIKAGYSHEAACLIRDAYEHIQEVTVEIVYVYDEED